MKQTARPPAQYVVAPGTQFRLVVNDYDKNKYAQCHYESQRTLIRCRQIRSKEDLAKRGGICEEHIGFAKLLETNHKKEVARCHAENDTKMQRRRFDPWITSNEYISDEDDYLQSIHEVAVSTQEWADNSILENHPLRHAKHFTEKDILKIKMDLVQKDIDDLMEFKRLVVAQAQKEHDSMDSDEEEDLPTDMAQRRVFNAARRYARKDYLTLTQTIDPVYKRCCVGPEMTDRQIIDQVIGDLLDKIDGKEEEKVSKVSMETQCENSAIQLTEFCFEHILLDRKQKMFAACVDCGTPAIRGEPTKCSFHIKECEKANNKCSCQKCAPEKPKESSRSNSRAEINVLDDDEETLGNLSRIETMPSPMQQFPSILAHNQQQQQHRRYQGPPAQLLRPSTMGPPPGTQGVPYQKSHPRVMQQTEESEEDEAKSQTCVRVRPLDPTLYGEGKRKLQQQNQRTTGRQGTPYHMQQKKTNILSPPGGQKMTFQGWKNQAAASSSGGPRQMYQSGYAPNRYTMSHNRPPPPPPRQIPLERVPDHLSPDEPVRYPSTVDQQRRGVPYYKHASFRRTDLPTVKQPSTLQPSTSTSSSQLLAPPQPSQQGGSASPKMYRPPQSRLPMAPHRAIAAGLNPADVGGGARSTPPSQSQQFRLPGAGGPPPPTPPQHRPQHHPQMYPQQQSGMPRPLTGTPLPPISLPRRPPPQAIPYRVHNGPNGERTTHYHAGIGAEPSRPSYSGGFRGPGASRNAPESPPEAERSSGVNAVVTALDSARHDSRFANINVRTFLSMGQMGQKDLSKMSQEEIEQMAAETEQEKVSRKEKASSGSSASSGNGGRTPRASFGVSGTPGQSPVKLPPSRRPPVPESVHEVVSSLTPGPQNPSRIKRKLEDDSEAQGAPEPKKCAPEDPPKAPEPKIELQKAQKTPEAVKGIQKAQKAPAPEDKTPMKMDPSTSSGASGEPSKAPEQVPVLQGNPLDLLAELSAAAEAEEGMGLAPPTSSSTSSGGGVRKTPKKTPSSSSSTVTPRRASGGKKKTAEEEQETIKK